MNRKFGFSNKPVSNLLTAPTHGKPTLIRQILESVGVVLIGRLGNTLRRNAIPQLILAAEMPPQQQQNEHQQRVAPDVRREGDEVARRVPLEEDLGPDGVAGGPGAEVQRDAHALLRLPGDVAAQHGHAEGLGGLTGES